MLRRPMFFLMNYPMDTKSRLPGICWSLFSHVITRWNRLGGIVGGLLYPLELAILSVRKHEGPATEIMLCRKR